MASLDWDGDTGPGPLLEPPAEDLRTQLGDGALRWATGTAERSVSRASERIPDALAPLTKVRALTQHMLIDVLLSLAGLEHPAADRCVIDPDLAEDLAVRDVAVTGVVSELREMQRDWLVQLVEAAVDADTIRVIPDIAASVTTTIDAWVGAITKAIAEERQKGSHARQARERAAIESLIANGAHDLAAISPQLDLRLSDWHLCCAIGAATGSGVDRQRLDSAVRSFAQLTGVTSPLRYETSGGNTYLWATSEHRVGMPSALALNVPPLLVAGIGEPHRGADGFRRSFMEAGDALRLALRTGADGAMTYRDAALANILSSDEERMNWFAEFELHELAADNQEAADLRNTLKMFFATRMRIAPTAERLFLHRNTLINRLERIETIIGHSLADRTAELQTSLVISELACASRATPPSAHVARAARARSTPVDLSSASVHRAQRHPAPLA